MFLSDSVPNTIKNLYGWCHIWYLYGVELVAMDTTRDEYNGGGTAYIFPNANEAQQTSYERMDFLSNGFKLRTNGGEWNGSGRNILYMAFAENPFVTSTGVPATAR